MDTFNRNCGLVERQVCITHTCSDEGFYCIRRLRKVQHCKYLLVFIWFGALGNGRLVP